MLFRSHKIIEKIKVNSSSDCFYEHLRETFEFLNEQIEKSAGKLMTNLGKMESIGQSKMAFIQSDLKQIIVEAIDKDKDITLKYGTKISVNNNLPNLL